MAVSKQSDAEDEIGEKSEKRGNVAFTVKTSIFPYRTETPLMEKNLGMAVQAPHSERPYSVPVSGRVVTPGAATGCCKPRHAYLEQDITNLKLLMGDPTFIDYFNVFLNLPVFGQHIMLSVNDQSFVFQPPLFAEEKDVNCYNLLKWLSRHRLPHFKASNLYAEYNLCLHLRRKRLHDTRFFCLPESGVPSTPEEFRNLMDKLLGHVMGMRMFRQSLEPTCGAQVFDCWVALEKLKYISNMEEHIRFRQSVAERFLRAGSKFKLQGQYPARAYLDFLNFKAAPDFVIEEEPDLSMAPPQEVYGEAEIHILSELKSIEILQKYLLHALASYWAPRFAIFAAKVLPDYVLQDAMKEEGPTLKEKSFEEFLARLVGYSPETVTEVKPSRSTQFVDSFGRDTSQLEKQETELLPSANVSNEQSKDSAVFEISQEPSVYPEQRVITGHIHGPSIKATRYSTGKSWARGLRVSHSAPCLHMYFELVTEGQIGSETISEDDSDESSVHPLPNPSEAAGRTSVGHTSRGLDQFDLRTSEDVSGDASTMWNGGKEPRIKTLSALDGSMTCIAASEAICKTSTPLMPISPTLSGPCDDRHYAAAQKICFDRGVWHSPSCETSFETYTEVKLESTSSEEMRYLLSGSKSTSVTGQGRSKSRSQLTEAAPAPKVPHEKVLHKRCYKTKCKPKSGQMAANSSTLSYGGMLSDIPDEANVLWTLSDGSSTGNLANIFGRTPVTVASEAYDLPSKSALSRPYLSCPCTNWPHYTGSTLDTENSRSSRDTSRIFPSVTEDMTNMVYPRSGQSVIPCRHRVRAGASKPTTWSPAPSQSIGAPPHFPRHGKSHVATPALASPTSVSMAGGSRDAHGTSFTPVSLPEGDKKSKIHVHMQEIYGFATGCSHIPSSVQTEKNSDTIPSLSTFPSCKESSHKSQTTSKPVKSNITSSFGTISQASFDFMSAQSEIGLFAAPSKVSQSSSQVPVHLHRIPCQTQIPWSGSKPHYSNVVCIKSAHSHIHNHPIIDPHAEVIPRRAASDPIFHKSTVEKVDEESSHTIPCSRLSSKTRYGASFTSIPLHRGESQTQIPWICGKPASKASLKSSQVIPDIKILPSTETLLTQLGKDTYEPTTWQPPGTSSPAISISVTRFLSDEKSDISHMPVCVHREDGSTHFLSFRRASSAKTELSPISDVHPSKECMGTSSIHEGTPFDLSSSGDSTRNDISNVSLTKERASSTMSIGTPSHDVQRETSVKSFCLHRSDGRTRIFSIWTLPSDAPEEDTSMTMPHSSEARSSTIVSVELPIQADEGLPTKQDGSKSNMQHAKDADSTRLSVAGQLHQSRSDSTGSHVQQRSRTRSRIVSFANLPSDLSPEASLSPSPRASGESRKHPLVQVKQYRSVSGILRPPRMADPRASSDVLLHDEKSNVSQDSLSLHRADACAHLRSFGITGNVSTEVSPMQSARPSRECLTAPLVHGIIAYDSSRKGSQIRKERSVSILLPPTDMASPRVSAEGLLQDASRMSICLHRTDARTRLLSTEVSPMPSARPSKEHLAVSGRQDRSLSGVFYQADTASPSISTERFLHGDRSDISRESICLHRTDARTRLLSIVMMPDDASAEVSPMPSAKPSREWLPMPERQSRSVLGVYLDQPNTASPSTSTERLHCDARNNASRVSFSLHRTDARTRLLSFGMMPDDVSTEVSPMPSAKPSREGLPTTGRQSRSVSGVYLIQPDTASPSTSTERLYCNARNDVSHVSFSLHRTDARTRLLSFGMMPDDASAEVSPMPSAKPSREGLPTTGRQSRSVSGVYLIQPDTASPSTSTERLYCNARKDASHVSFSLHRADARTRLLSFGMMPDDVSAEASPMPSAQPSREWLPMTGRQSRCVSGVYLDQPDTASPNVSTERLHCNARKDGSHVSFSLHRADARTRLLSFEMTSPDVSAQVSPMPSAQPSREWLPMTERQSRSVSGVYFDQADTVSPSISTERLHYNARSDAHYLSFCKHRADALTQLLSFTSTQAEICAEVSPIPSAQPSRECFPMHKRQSRSGSGVYLDQADTASPSISTQRFRHGAGSDTGHMSFSLHRADARTRLLSFANAPDDASVEISPMPSAQPSREYLATHFTQGRLYGDVSSGRTSTRKETANTLFPVDAASPQASISDIRSRSSIRSFCLHRSDGRTRIMSIETFSPRMSSEVTPLTSARPSREGLTMSHDTETDSSFRPFSHYGADARTENLSYSWASDLPAFMASPRVSSEVHLHDVRSDVSERAFNLRQAEARTRLVSFARLPSYGSPEASLMSSARPSMEYATMPETQRKSTYDELHMNGTSTPTIAPDGLPAHACHRMLVEPSKSGALQQDEPDLLDTLDEEDILGIIQAFDEDSLWEKQGDKGSGSGSSQATSHSPEESKSSCSCSFFDDVADEVCGKGLKESYFRPMLPLPLRHLMDLTTSLDTKIKSKTDVPAFLGITCDKVAGSPFSKYLLSKHNALLQQVLQFWEMTIEYLQASDTPLDHEAPSQKGVFRNQLYAYLMKNIFPKILPETLKDLKRSLLTGRDVWYLEIVREIVVQALAPEWYRFVKEDTATLNKELFPDERKGSHFSHLFISGVWKANQPSASVMAQDLILTRIDQGPWKPNERKPLVMVTKNIEVPRYLTTLALNIALNQSLSWLVDDFQPSVDLLPNRLESSFGSLFYIPLKVVRISLLEKMIPKTWKVANLRVASASAESEPRPRVRPQKKSKRSKDGLDVRTEETVTIAKLLKLAHQNKPKNIENILSHDAHAVLFRHKLIKDGQSTVKMDFCQEVGELSFIMDPTLIAKTRAAIKEKYFRSELAEELKDISPIVLSKCSDAAETPTLQELEAARVGVMAELQKKYFDDYIKTIPKSSRGLKLLHSTETSSMISLDTIKGAKRKKWRGVFLNVSAFLRAFDYPGEYKKFEKYIEDLIKEKEQAGEPKRRITEVFPSPFNILGKLKKTKKHNSNGDTEVQHDSPRLSDEVEMLEENKVFETYTDFTPGGTEFYLQKVTQDMRFMKEARRYVDLVDQIRESLEIPRTQGFTPFGDEVSRLDTLHQKANVLFRCFIMSQSSPRVQINISTKMATQIEAAYEQHGPKRGLFFRAYIQVFPIVYIMWKRYMRELALRQPSKPHPESKSQTKSARPSTVTTDAHKISPKDTARRSTMVGAKGALMAVRGSKRESEMVMAPSLPTRKKSVIFASSKTEGAWKNSVRGSKLFGDTPRDSIEVGEEKAADQKIKPTSSPQLSQGSLGSSNMTDDRPVESSGPNKKHRRSTRLSKFEISNVFASAAITKTKKSPILSAVAAHTLRRGSLFPVKKKVQTAPNRSSNETHDWNDSESLFGVASKNVFRSKVADQFNAKKLPGTTDYTNNQSRNENLNMNVKGNRATTQDNLSQRMKMGQSSNHPQSNTTSHHLVSKSMKSVSQRAPPVTSVCPPQYSICKTSLAKRRKPPRRKKAALSTASLLTSLQDLLVPPLSLGNSFHRGSNESSMTVCSPQAQHFLPPSEKNVTSLVTLPLNLQKDRGTDASGKNQIAQGHDEESDTANNRPQCRDTNESKTVCLPTLRGSLSYGKMPNSDIYKSADQTLHQTDPSKLKTVHDLASCTLSRAMDVSRAPTGKSVCVTDSESRCQGSRRNGSLKEGAMPASCGLSLPRDLNASTAGNKPRIISSENSGDKDGERNLYPVRRDSLAALPVVHGTKQSSMESTSRNQTDKKGICRLESFVDSPNSSVSKKSQDSKVLQCRMPSVSKSQKSSELAVWNPDGCLSACSWRMDGTRGSEISTASPRQRRKLLVPRKTDVASSSNSSRTKKCFPAVSAKKVTASKTSKSEFSSKCPKLPKKLKRQNVSFGQSGSSIIYQLTVSSALPFPPVVACPDTEASGRSANYRSGEKSSARNSLSVKPKNAGKFSCPKSLCTKWPALTVPKGKKKAYPGTQHFAKKLL